MKASVILPAYNEEKNIGNVIKKIPDEYEIIVVDDGSKDDTLDVAKKLGCVCIRLNKNYGKGFACRTGAKIASNKNIVFMDSDGQLNAWEIPKMISALKTCDLVVGTRNMKSIPTQRKISNNSFLLRAAVCMASMIITPGRKKNSSCPSVLTP